MTSIPPPRPSRLFTVRLWLEELGHAEKEWRGKVHDMSSGETRYFRDWPALEMFLLASLEVSDEIEAGQAKGRDGSS